MEGSADLDGGKVIRIHRWETAGNGKNRVRLKSQNDQDQKQASGGSGNRLLKRENLEKIGSWRQSRGTWVVASP